MRDKDGMGPARDVILVMCPNVKGHLTEPSGLYVFEMYVTLWNDEVLKYTGEPIPKDVWVWAFQPVLANIVFERCDKCRLSL